MDPNARDRLTGIRFKRKQLRFLEAIWNHDLLSDHNVHSPRLRLATPGTEQSSLGGFSHRRLSHNYSEDEREDDNEESVTESSEEDSKRSTNREFVVVRFLPAELGQTLCQYLVFIPPFVDLLDRQCHLGFSEQGRSSPLLFRVRAISGPKPWPPGRLTTILKSATSKLWNKPVNSQLFRQLCIGITEKHVREIHQPFNRFDDVSENADRNVIFAWQSGHRPLQRATTYGLDGAFPTALQPQLLESYEWASTCWHEFLHLPSKTIPPTTPDAANTLPLGQHHQPRQEGCTLGSTSALLVSKQRTPQSANRPHEPVDVRNGRSSPTSSLCGPESTLPSLPIQPSSSDDDNGPERMMGSIQQRTGSTQQRTYHCSPIRSTPQ
ncbi:hypothetical protein FOVG_19206 [Fusarium oxysporum f. sp. pisi HDV247]|uniref:Uncharacterized protein n=1 Tax=Fusarium oxysporum f. sp. pisi HDV247 TaxID=1080344 RepID=W9NH25_FUSOX|nr:hypothetical protein FOVG_19206 [Fusarium oxysporum f. sp. pisi HDV247]